MIKKDSGLTEGEQKYMRCVVKVAAKNAEQCNREKLWFETVDGKECYNPYAVCAKSTRHSCRGCGDAYNLEGFTDDQLKAYASLNRVNIPSPYNRDMMLKNIYSWKEQKYGK